MSNAQRSVVDNLSTTEIFIYYRKLFIDKSLFLWYNDSGKAVNLCILITAIFGNCLSTKV